MERIQVVNAGWPPHSGWLDSGAVSFILFVFALISGDESGLLVVSDVMRGGMAEASALESLGVYAAVRREFQPPVWVHPPMFTWLPFSWLHVIVDRCSRRGLGLE